MKEQVITLWSWCIFLTRIKEKLQLKSGRNLGGGNEGNYPQGKDEEKVEKTEKIEIKWRRDKQITPCEILLKLCLWPSGLSPSYLFLIITYVYLTRFYSQKIDSTNRCSMPMPRFDYIPDNFVLTEEKFPNQTSSKLHHSHQPI